MNDTIYKAAAGYCVDIGVHGDHHVEPLLRCHVSLRERERAKERAREREKERVRKR